MNTITSPPPLSSLAVGDDDRVFRAMVVGVRRLKHMAFLRLRLPRAFVQAVWTGALPPGVCEHASVEVRGRVVAASLTDAGLSHQDREIRVSALEVLSSPAVPAPFDISKRTLGAGAEARLDHRPVALRHPAMAAVFAVQHEILQAFRRTLSDQGFTELHTPRIVAAAAEGGADVFELDYFGTPATLAQSPQLYKELATGAFLRVFEVGPVFRAEKHNTSRHLAQYTSLDVELGPIRTFDEVMALQTGLLADVFEAVRERCAPELSRLEVVVPEVSEIPVVTFAEAKARIAIEPGSDDLSPAEERAVSAWVEAETGCPLVFVTHYPSSKRPFYAMDDPNQGGTTVSFDLLFRGLEITTGGQRIHERGPLVDKLVARGMAPEALRFFHDVHAVGLPPHGGFGLGLERLTQTLLGLAHIKEATLFPRDRTRLVP